MLCTFLTIVTCLSCSLPNFYALIGQNLPGEFKRKIYTASWNLFTLTAEANKVLCQLVVFLTVFPLYVQNEKQLLRVFCYSWLFWLRNESLVKVGNPISDDIFFVFHLAGFVGGLKSLKWFWSHLIAFRSCISSVKHE